MLIKIDFNHWVDPTWVADIFLADNGRVKIFLKDGRNYWTNLPLDEVAMRVNAGQHGLAGQLEEILTRVKTMAADNRQLLDKIALLEAELAGSKALKEAP